MTVKLHNNIKALNPFVEVIFPDEEQKVQCVRVSVGHFSIYETYISDLETVQVESLAIAKDAIELEKAIAQADDAEAHEIMTTGLRQLNERRRTTAQYVCKIAETLKNGVIKQCVPVEKHAKLDELPPEILLELFTLLLYGEPDESTDSREVSPDAAYVKKNRKV